MCVKVHIFWEGHNILRNLHQSFVTCTASQIISGDFAKYCGLLRIYELYKLHYTGLIIYPYLTVFQMSVTFFRMLGNIAIILIWKSFGMRIWWKICQKSFKILLILQTARYVSTYYIILKSSISVILSNGRVYERAGNPS